MGLAASQARLLLLTARKSDLEYRAQMICQRKVMLAMQTEELASNYSKALNNRKLHFTYAAESNPQTTKTELLTYEGLTAAQNAKKYRIVDSMGRVVITTAEAASGSCQRFFPKESYQQGESPYLETIDESMYTTKYSEMLKNPEAFQNALQAGTFFIEEITVEPGPEVEVEDAEGNVTPLPTFVSSTSIKAISAMDDVASKLYQDDDAAAAAEYEYQSLLIQNQDKQLDVELKQVETQQKACETEIDSVKKVLDKNIEKSFKTFA